MNGIKRVFGSLRSSADSRDHRYAAKMGAAMAVPAPESDIHVSINGGICWDQETIGSCEAHGGAAVMNFFYPDFMPSRLAIYYEGRAREGTIAQDAGMETRDLMKVLQAGTFSENAWPYDVSKFADAPPIAGTGISAKIGSYSRLTSDTEILACLSSGIPHVYSFQVPDYFEQSFFSTGILTHSLNAPNFIGGHLVTAVGHTLNFKATDDFKASGIDPALVEDVMVLTRNSWGVTGGLKSKPGHFWAPISWITNPSTGGDSWAAHSDPATTADLP